MLRILPGARNIDALVIGVGWGHVTQTASHCHVVMSLSRGFSAQWDHIEFFLAGHISSFGKLSPKSYAHTNTGSKAEGAPIQLYFRPHPGMNYCYTI